MNFKEKFLSIIKGYIPESPLFIPRLDIWYNHNVNHDSLPEKYKGLTLSGLTETLGVGFHSVIPDFIRSAKEEDIVHRGLGLYNNPDFPYYADFSKVDFTVQKSESGLEVTYFSKKGKITTSFAYSDELFKSGISIPEITEHALKSINDYPILGDIISNVKITPKPEQYESYSKRIGEKGVSVAFLSLACGPYQHIMRDLRKYEEFCLDLYDDPVQMENLVHPLTNIYNEILNSINNTSAEVAIFGANYDDTITYPPFFEKYILPWLNKSGDILHSTGKYLLTHTDGENKGLMELFKRCNFDIADSICPEPMTKVSFSHYRDLFGKKVTIWGGIPSIIMLSTFPFDDFKIFIKKIFESSKPYNNIVFSIADTLPPNADFGRVEYIRDMCEER
jgi:hypothetical protein